MSLSVKPHKAASISCHACLLAAGQRGLELDVAASEARDRRSD